MSLVPSVRLRVYPDDCDAYGHVNQAAFLRLFERARWEALALGPGMDVFTRAGTWPAIRKASVEYFAPAFPTDLLRFDLVLTHQGRTSFSLYQLVRRDSDGVLVAAAQFLAVCIDDRGRPRALPEALAGFFGVRPETPADMVRPFLVGGALLAAEMQGDGPACLLVHGFPLDRTLWRAQLAGLAGWRRLAPDLRGFGLSDPPPQGWTLAAYADDLARILDGARVGKAAVCGLSMGGYIALEMWRRHRDRIRALILANTRAEADPPDGRKRRDEMIERVQRDGAAAVVDTMLPRVLAPATLAGNAHVVAHVRTMMRDCSAPGLIAALAAMRDRPDSTDLLREIDVPTLVVAGAEDTLIPVDSQSVLAAKIRGARLEVVGGAGHLTPVEQPKAFNRVVGAFLETLR
ncbi:MAG: alpha/beta fold hydrolase [Gemmatimonadetes bacterium]|nr:alpha/beta fold hydrolase [Gemmatimonadota bacterium]